MACRSAARLAARHGVSILLLLPWLTVGQNVEFGMRYRTDLSESEKLARRDHYLDLVGLYEFFDAYPNRLSGGCASASPSPARWPAARK